MRIALLILLGGLAGGSAIWYVVAFRAWARVIAEPAVAKLNSKKRVAFMKTDPYRKPRNQVRFAMYATMLLLGAIYFVMRMPG